MPEPLIFLILLVLAPGAIILWFAMRAYSSRLEAILVFLFCGLLVTFLFQWGQFPYVGSFGLRYLMPVVVLGAGIWVLWRVRARPWYARPPLRVGFLFGFIATAILILVVLVWTALQAHAIDQPTVDMQFPLRNGTFYISTGGSNAVLNLHHKQHTPSQMFAIDIDLLDSWGRCAESLVPVRADEFFIFGDTVFSPCGGIVISAEDGRPENIPFEYDPASGSGNVVRIESNSLHVALLHLMQGSVMVRSGDSVAAGDPVGRVGNSGFSTQPHLHMQVSRTVGQDSAQAGVPVRFGGRFLVRNDLFTN